jgi:hypothetical protein
MLISRNYFDALQKELLLCDSHPKHPGFAIGILVEFRKRHDKYMEHLAGCQQGYPQYSFGCAKSHMAN